MSLSRALTTCRLRLSSDFIDGGNMPRSNSTRKAVPRHKISAPIQLIHTTNMLSYNAPDLPRPSRSNSTTTRPDDDSDAQTAASTPPTSPEVAPGERPSSPQPNHLTSYFKQPAGSLAASEEDPPKIPKRAPSHTKKNSFENLARSRSSSRLSRDSDFSASTRPGQTFSRSASTSTRASSQHPSNETHPFGQELAKVHELAEEYSVGDGLATIDEEKLYLDSRGLKKLTADDYLGVVQGITSTFFPEAKHATPVVPLWI
ncbi:hypothetical protein HRG_005900 [Hirsutella rhossiliensis]|uniref:Uncharacterized protein n=1 Tax=Hirsutella rhossiliensis TaxID=111463 RepID=A0A9P8MY51_9HYPO|nr:uncharacterized protein HRG_05900 [Hirsutella rhossiliensis]KAH0963390.1 hypothetical protein HRG_05900 [Hirsutella rhossiliensis]